MAVLTELPWELPVVALPRTKILVVYNSEYAWTQGVCEYYCAQRGIPQENIIGVPAGVANLWISTQPDHNLTAAEFDDFILPIAAALESGGHKAVILGPKFPSKLVVRNFNSDGTMDTAPDFGGNYITISVSYLISTAKLVAADRCAGWPVGGSGGVLVQLDPALTGYELSDRIFPLAGARPAAYEWVNGGGLPSGPIELHDLPLWPGNAIAKMPMPSADQQRELWASVRPHVGVARLGWSPGFHDNATPTALPDETESGVTDLIDRATAVMASVDAAANRAKPHLLGITEGGYLTAEDCRSYYRQLVSWGIPTDYMYFYTSAAQPTTGTDDPPFADAWGNLTTMGTGAVSPRPYQYFCIVGGGSNGTPDNFSNDALNFDGNQEALAGGNSLFSGQSYPYVLNPYSISRGVAIAGFVDTIHQGGSLVMYAAALHILLLRGMSYLEAMCWFNVTGNSLALPIGDPLYTPYGRRSPFGMLGGVIDADAVAVGPDPTNLSFAPITETARNSVITSEGLVLAGMLTPLPIRVSWGAEWSVSSASSGFKKENGTVWPGQTLWVRHTGAGAGRTKVSRVHVGTTSAPFSTTAAVYSDGTPIAFKWLDRVGVDIGLPTFSLGLKITGFDVPVEVSVSPGSEFRFTLAWPDVWYSTPQMIYPQKGQDAQGNEQWFTYITLRHTAAATPDTPTTTTCTVGGVEGTWTSWTKSE